MDRSSPIAGTSLLICDKSGSVFEDVVVVLLESVAFPGKSNVILSILCAEVKDDILNSSHI